MSLTIAGYARRGLSIILLAACHPCQPLQPDDRPRLGLAGFRFDPEAQISGVVPLISRIEVISTPADPERAAAVWAPADGAVLDFVR